MPTTIRRSRCRACAKVSYPSQEQAWAAIGQMIRSSADGHKVYAKIPDRVYACPHGHDFHVTSTPARPGQ